MMIKPKLALKPKKISIVLGILTIIVFTILAKERSKDDCLDIKEKYLNIEYKGIVVRKFEDKENHAIPTLIIREKNQEKIFSTFRDFGGLYAYAQIADSIIKEKGTLEVRIVRDKNDTTINMDFNCP